MFPASPRGRGDQPTAASSPSGGDQGPHVASGEVDFFLKKKTNVDAVMRKENNHSFIGGDQSEVNTGLQLLTANTGIDQSTVYDVEDRQGRIKLRQLQVELERMNGENQRLRGMLANVSNNYNDLQMQLATLMQQSQNSRNDHSNQLDNIVDRKLDEEKLENEGELVQWKFLNLSPGVTNRAADEQSDSSSEERTLSGSPRENMETISKNKRTDDQETEAWASNKAPKSSPSNAVEQSTMRKARVSVRARSDAPMILDGCQWRKYGQKMAKGNPSPRAYYRCTMAVGCPVRKQVQRCANDRTILITTYEGTHNHPLPPAAIGMASATLAAASMLLSGSMPSADDGFMNPNFLARTILPCSTNLATISASSPFPTITLDLTQDPNPTQFQEPAPQFQVPFPMAHQSFSPAQFTHMLSQALYNQSKFSGLQMSQQHQLHHQPAFADSLSAAAAAITADPNFTAALAVAISSIIGGSHANSNNNNNGNVNSVDSNKTSNSFPRELGASVE